MADFQSVDPADDRFLMSRTELKGKMARLEPYGMTIAIGVLFLLPLLKARMGIDINAFAQIVTRPAGYLIGTTLRLTGKGASRSQMETAPPSQIFSRPSFAIIPRALPSVARAMGLAGSGPVPPRATDCGALSPN